jgi:hypothetical protein
MTRCITRPIVALIGKWVPSLTLEAIVRSGQRIRLRASSRAASEWKIPPEAEGTVICHYRILAGSSGASDRLDVRFSPKTVIWGAPAAEFEVIGEISEPSRTG